MFWWKIKENVLFSIFENNTPQLRELIEENQKDHKNNKEIK
jgi:hypothetical protein